MSESADVDCEMDDNCESCSNPNLATDTNADDEKKLKGDAIGNTMYSERFVLKTLIKLKDNKWDEELESDMSTIWDMATEEDVVDFLYENNFFDISSDILQETKELRLMEIIIGIIGNMCVFSDYAEKLMKINNVIDSVSRECNDALVLIQTMRVYKALFYCKKINHHLLTSDQQIELVNYILQSSRNHELLLYTLQVTAEMVDKINDKSICCNFLDNINEALNEICKNYDDNLLSSEFHKSICAYSKVLENLCTALNLILDKDSNVFKKILDEKSNAIKSTMSNIEFILGIISDLDFIKIETESFEYYIYCFANFLVTFNTPFREKIILHFSNIFNTIIENNLVFDGSVYESITSFIIYSFCSTDSNILKTTFKDWKKTRLTNLFINNIVNKNECNEQFIRLVEKLCT